MDQKKLNEILDKHIKWLNSEDGGSRANLRRADLCGADLRRADLCGANLRGADLCDANLCGADLCGANLCDANLRRADLCGANLRGANLRGADLCDANLRGADLCGANLCDADLAVLQLPFYTVYVQKTHTRIGCKFYSNKDWRGFSDEQIEEMDSNALEFWNTYKELVFAAMELFEKEV